MQHALKTLVAAAALALALPAAQAQELRPYPEPRITELQWQGYFEQVRSLHGKSERSFPQENLVVYQDSETMRSWAFTAPGHPAHPAWVARQLIQGRDGISIRQVGYFAGDEAQFTEMFRAYQKLSERLREGLGPQTPGGAAL